MTELASLPTQYQFLKIYLSHLAEQDHVPLHTLHVQGVDSAQSPPFILKCIHELRLLVNFIIKSVCNWEKYEELLGISINSLQNVEIGSVGNVGSLGRGGNPLENENDNAVTERISKVNAEIMEILIGDKEHVLLQGDSVLVSRAQLSACVNALLKTQLYRVFQMKYAENTVQLSEGASLLDFDWNVSHITKSQAGVEQLLCNLMLYARGNANQNGARQNATKHNTNTQEVDEMTPSRPVQDIESMFVQDNHGDSSIHSSHQSQYELKLDQLQMILQQFDNIERQLQAFSQGK